MTPLRPGQAVIHLTLGRTQPDHQVNMHPPWAACHALLHPLSWPWPCPGPGHPFHSAPDLMPQNGSGRSCQWLPGTPRAHHNDPDYILHRHGRAIMGHSRCRYVGHPGQARDTWACISRCLTAPPPPSTAPCCWGCRKWEAWRLLTLALYQLPAASPAWAPTAPGRRVGSDSLGAWPGDTLPPHTHLPRLCPPALTQASTWLARPLQTPFPGAPGLPFGRSPPTIFPVF